MNEIKRNKNSFGVYLGEPSPEQLNQFFYLHEKDLKLIATMRLPSTKLGFALQLGSVRFLGTFFTYIDNIPNNVVLYLATQLNVDPSEIKNYKRRQTKDDHVKMIKLNYDYQEFTHKKIEGYLFCWLLNRATYTTESSDMLFDMLLKNVWMKR